MQEKIQEIFKVLKSRSLPITTEKEVQLEIEKLFTEKKISFEREYRFDNKNIVDFFVNGIAIEVKIKGVKKAVYKQCERYCEFNETKALILVTNLTMGFPEQLNGKDCYYYSLSKNWL